MNISREDRSLANDVNDRLHNLRYLAPEQLGRSALPGEEHRSTPIFLLPAEDGRHQDKDASAAGRIAGLEKQLADLARELTLATEHSRLEGEKTGRGQAAAQFEQALAQSRGAVAASLEAFGRERRDYFRRVESEVVRLALAIARKVLHREAQMDSMLLSGIVRAALDRLEESSSVVLRVPAAEGDGWKRVLANAPQQPKLVEDVRLRPGDCVLESQMGTVELGIGTQLEEIERGFFDLLREAPAPPDSDAGERAPDDGRTPSAIS